MVFASQTEFAPGTKTLFAILFFLAPISMATEGNVARRLLDVSSSVCKISSQFAVLNAGHRVSRRERPLGMKSVEWENFPTCIASMVTQIQPLIYHSALLLWTSLLPIPRSTAMLILKLPTRFVVVIHQAALSQHVMRVVKRTVVKYYCYFLLLL
jgi:hypothetical protein